MARAAAGGGEGEPSGGAGTSGSVLSELQREKRLVCVEYPGVVQDVGKTLLTLGGEEEVSRIYADPTKRLELYFRPKDPYCHPVCANRFPTSSMVLKVKKKTRRTQTEAGGLEEEIDFEVEILGVISTVYKFQGNLFRHLWNLFVNKPLHLLVVQYTFLVCFPSLLCTISLATTR
ncbi:general transcription factor 3C polypeptide 5-like [Python bivittatus]|uniref:General transcription factor 3C polypeptide 5 n=1 Tax=Python bivittatus TaxID=176946 RepID=A0A9F2NB75_PYTBI|nr:general transcription factor 3C polypeptide 5-like [Python bivittatus]